MRKSIKRLTAAVLFMSITVSSTFFLTACKNNDVSSKNKIVVFNYGDYIDSTLLDKFEKETGIKVVYEEFLTPEAMYTKFKNGAVDYDLICCSDYMLDKMIKEKDVRKIDYDKMKYIKISVKNTGICRKVLTRHLVIQFLITGEQSAYCIILKWWIKYLTAGMSYGIRSIKTT